MGAACVCLLLCLCMPPWSLKAQCRRLNSSSFPKSAPAPERPILTNDGSVFAFCISQNPQHHAFLIFLLHPVSDQSPGSVNSVSLISLTTNSPHSTPTALVGVNALPAGSVHTELLYVLWGSCTFPRLQVFMHIFPLSRILLPPSSLSSTKELPVCLSFDKLSPAISHNRYGDEVGFSSSLLGITSTKYFILILSTTCLFICLDLAIQHGGR